MNMGKWMECCCEIGFGWNLDGIWTLEHVCACVCVFEELGPVIYGHIITRCSGEYPDRPLWWCLYGPSWGCLIFRKGFKDMKIKKHGPPIELRPVPMQKHSQRIKTEKHSIFNQKYWWMEPQILFLSNLVIHDFQPHTCMNMPVMLERSWNSDVFGHWIRGRWQRLSVSIFCHLAEVLPVASRLWKTKIAKNGKSYVDDFIIFHT